MGETNDEEAAIYGQREGDVNPDSPIDEGTHLRLDEIEDEESSPTPRFLRDGGSHKRWNWIPPSIRRIGKKVLAWAKGPKPPQIQVIRPWFPYIQEAPLRFLDKHLPKRKHRILLLVVFYFCWIISFGIVLRESTFASDVAGYGTPVDIGCGNTYWQKGNICGINGNDCRPFNGSAFAFRCQANCKSYKVLEPRAVGAQEIVYRQFVIGGPSENKPNDPPIYRGDSFICGAAIHAGVIDNANGGCGIVELSGAHRNFESSKRNGMLSIGFDSYFPKSFTFQTGTSCDAKDLRWQLLGISLFFTILLSLFTSSPAVFFFSIFTGVFAHTGFASDPPDHTSLADLASNLLGKFLPAMFVAFIMYKYVITRTLKNLKAQIEKTVFWLGALWFGALTNYTLDWIPISRLNAHDLNQQPGAKLALALILLFIAFTVIQQIYYFRLEGRLLRYLALYGTFVGTILLSLILPGLNLRIHHYIIGLLLLPGTSMQTRPVLIYQGILVGLFINGIARWGFDSILQTPDALQGDAQHNSKLPELLEPIISIGLSAANISFSWVTPPFPYDGISVLVNDVERFRGYTDEGFGSDSHFFWQRNPATLGPEYFRFGYLQGSTTWDYTKAGTWTADGNWAKMEPGPSKIRRRDFRDEGHA